MSTQTSGLFTGLLNTSCKTDIKLQKLLTLGYVMATVKLINPWTLASPGELLCLKRENRDIRNADGVKNWGKNHWRMERFVAPVFEFCTGLAEHQRRQNGVMGYSSADTLAREAMRIKAHLHLELGASLHYVSHQIPRASELSLRNFYCLMR